MRWTLAMALVAACSSYSYTRGPDAGSGGGGTTCAGNVYDPCGSDGDCMSNFCHDYSGAGITVCTVTCGGSATCPMDSTGATPACNMMGNCKPSKANVCGSDS